MPYSVKVLLESVVRQLDGELVTEEHINNVINWRKDPGKEIPFKLARVIFQDFTPRLSEIHHFFL